MRNVLTAIVLSVLVTGTIGCSSPSRVPVDLECVDHFIHHHGLSCCRYPYSCPRCPYFDYAAGVWRDGHSGQVVTVSSASTEGDGSVLR
jgi:hypothetical protein